MVSDNFSTGIDELKMKVLKTFEEFGKTNGKKRALITGITGQDGPYLAEFLLNKGYEVYGMYRRSSLEIDERISELRNEINLVGGDLTDVPSMIKILKEINPDEVYNLASQSFVPDSWTQPISTSEITGVGVVKILEAIKLVNPKIRFYQASSSEMFGNTKEIPQNEKTPMLPRSPYGFSKVLGYNSTINYRESFGIHASNGILFNHESPKRGKQFVTRKISYAVAKIKLGIQEFFEIGNLGAKRDWGFAGDFVEAMWLMLQQEKPDDFVIATGKSYSVREFVEEAFKVVDMLIIWEGEGIYEVGRCDGKIVVKINPKFYRHAEVDTLCGDYTKAKKKLGWKPRTEFKDLVRMMVESDLKELQNKPIFGYELKNCRMCDSKELYKFLDLGFAPLSDAILTSEELKEPEVLYPLTVLQCMDCGLTQSGYVVNPTLMYGKKYKYESSITEAGKRHFFYMADSIIQRFNLERDSFIIDIGSNVGVLLEGFKRKGMKILGIDPAPKICKIANERGIETWRKFLNLDVAKEIISRKGKAKIITGTNVFAHIDDKNNFINNLKEILDEDGIFIFEVPYLVDLFENLEYDTIYLEHLEYLSVKPLVNFFNKHEMDIFDIERYEIHGKSIRVFVCRKDKRPISNNINELLELEDKKGIYRKEVLDEFAKKVEDHKKKLIDLLKKLKDDNKKIVGISAPAKGNTILNYCKIGPDSLDYMTEKSIIKRGCYTPGMHIPIVDEEKLLKDQPDYGIILAWNFANEIIKNNEEFSKKGGKFIIPIPFPTIR